MEAAAVNDKNSYPLESSWDAFKGAAVAKWY